MPSIRLEDPRFLVTETCCVCGVEFAMPSELQASRKSDLKEFYCPNGHSQTYTESEAQRLTKKLAKAQHRLESEALARESLNVEISSLGRTIIGLRGRLTRVLRRKR
jgi:hypothetical protein